MSIVAGDAFGLGDVFILISNPVTIDGVSVGAAGTTIDTKTVGNTATAWSSAQTHGWFGGGSGPLATVDRIDFSNDTGTANIRGSLSLARDGLAATGNSNYGWFGGGSVPGPTPLVTVDRIDFSNDSSTASPRGPLSLERREIAATGNSNYGWFGGGAPGAPGFPPSISRVDRIDFSNDSSTASVRGPLSAARERLAATGNSNYGWFGGGYVTAAPGEETLSTVNRIDFANDSSASVRGSLISTRRHLAATGNSNYGWFGSGSPAPAPTFLFTSSTVDRINFANDVSTASVRGPLSLARRQLAATGNSNYGWFGGGGSVPGGPVYSTVDRIDFSNDSVSASPRGPLSLSRSNLAATSGQARSSSVRLAKTGGYGWFGGSSVSTVDRIDFSNDSSKASVRGPLSLERGFLAATGNSNYGWFGGGQTPTPATTSRVERINFSNDSSTASIRGPLSSARYYFTATGNSNYGWFGGGVNDAVPSATVATVDRIDFANDSATASPRGSLSLSRSLLAATGNSNYGWFGGGTPGPLSTVDRIDFSNDSATASVRGPLSAARAYLAATGNSNYGWFGGGFSQISTVDRIDFSNDSSTASPRGPLSLARYSLAATGNSNYGWFGGGGSVPAILSTVDRINFSNDSSTASVRGSLSSSRDYFAATSNASFS